ncbi:MAG: MATE family efflux transporter [Proteobacteria bacterium]|nr:MATE family efflux transporter [Pseudomonadota bacterium]
MKGDLTQGPILKTLVAFSVPMLIGNLLQTLNGTINSIWVGRLLGESALAATANANIMMFLMFAAVFGFSMASSVRIGHAFGARDLDGAKAAFGAGLAVALWLASVAGFAGWLGAARLLRLLATPAESRVEALAYLSVIFLTMPLSALTIALSSALRAVGDVKGPFRALLATVVLDVLFNPLLIRGLGPIPALGIAGSAMATALANLVGMGLLLLTINQPDCALRLGGQHHVWLRPAHEQLRYIITKGVPMGAQMLLISTAGIIFIGLVNREGLAAAAAFGASLQLWNYLQMPALAISAAVSAMVAQNIGARQFARVGQITLTGIAVSLVTTGVGAGLIVLFDRPLLSLFLKADGPTMAVARHIQLICTWPYMLTGVVMILTGTMRAYGAVMRPLLVMFASMYVVRLGFYFAALPWLKGDAVWWSTPFSSTIGVALMVLAYVTMPPPQELAPARG